MSTLVAVPLPSLDVAACFQGLSMQRIGLSPAWLFRYRCRACGEVLFQDDAGAGSEGLLAHAEAHQQAVH